MLFFGSECRNFCRYKKKIRNSPRIFSLFDPNIMIMLWKNVNFVSQRPLMSNSSPENIWGSIEIASHFFAIFGKKFFFLFYAKNPVFFTIKIPRKFHFFRQNKSNFFGFLGGCKSCPFPLKLIREVHKH